MKIKICGITKLEETEYLKNVIWVSVDSEDGNRKQDRKQDVLYLSADVDSLYPVLLNRIVRSDASKKTVLQDKYDTKEFPNSTNWIITLSFLLLVSLLF